MGAVVRGGLLARRADARLGIGLVAHAYHVFGWEKPVSEERIQREIDRAF